MVTDLNASATFYEDVIGLDPVQLKDSNVEFNTGQCTLVLEEDLDQGILDQFGLPQPGEQRGGGVIVAIAVEKPEAVNKISERAVEAGNTVRMEPTNVDWGRRMALLADPDGYTVEVSAVTD